MRIFLKFSIFLALIFTTISGFGQNCSINSGIDQTICLGETFRLSGAVGGPFDASTINWSVVSQPVGASVVIANPNSFAANAGTSLVAGTYVFRLSGKCGDGITTQDDVSIVVNAVPATPTQLGTNSFTCYTGAPIAISGTAPIAGETVFWTVGAGLGTFSAPTSNTTNFTPNFPVNECSNSFRIDITYTIRNTSGCSRSVTRAYTFSRNYTFSAIADPVPVCGTSTILKGSCAGSGTALWSLVSSPAGAPAPVFGSAGSNISSVSNLVPGNYVFKYDVTSTCGNNTANVNVTVASATGVSKANAGKDQHFCTMPGTISLSGNSPAVGETATWSLVSGGSVTITNPNNPNTTVSGLTGGGAPYHFLYTIATAGGCSTKDTVAVYLDPPLTLTNTQYAACFNANISPGTLGQSLRLGNFQYNELDTVNVTVTYLSGPAATATSVIGGGSSFSNFQPSNNLTSIAIGQTITQKFWNTGNTSSANELYLNRGTSPASNAYYLYFNATTSTTGTYRFKVSFANKCSTYVAEAVIERGISVAVNAGTDVALTCGLKTATLVGSLNNNFAYWTTVSLPAGATDPINVTNQSLKNPPLVGLIDGTYVFRYSNDAGKFCTQSSDEVKVVVSSLPPATPNAGADVTQCAGTVTLNGSAIPNGALAQWSVVSPSGAAVTFSDATIANPNVSGLLPSTAYTFRYTLTNGCGSSFDDVVFTTTANTGPSKPTITFSGSGCSFFPNFGAYPQIRNFTITHTELSAGQTGVLSVIAVPASSLTSWSQTSSTATTKGINIALSNDAAISFVWCVSDANCASQTYCDTATAYFAGNFFSLNAGPDQNLCSINSFPAVATLTGTNTTMSKQWSLVSSSNGQGVSFGSATANTTTVTLPAAGTYRFKYELIGPDPTCQPYVDYVTIVAATPGSLAQAGPDVTICNPSGTFNLAATPLAVGTGAWEIEQVIDGAVPSIANTSSATSAITFTQSGTVVLRWNSYGSNPTCGASSSDLVTITYVAPANAGTDISLCRSTSANLNAANPAPADGAWSQISGPNMATFANTTNPSTLITGLVSGTYTFRWTVNNAGACITTDDMVVTINNIAATANAGPDFGTCNGSTNNKILLNATAATAGLTGTWVVTSFPSGATAGTFSNANDPKAIYTGATVAGDYIFSWTFSDGVCSTTDFITVTVDPSSCVTITGKVFNDTDGNTIINVGENGTTASTNLYVYLVNPSGVIVDSARVRTDGSYTLDASQSTDYTIQLSAIQYPIGNNVNNTPIDNTPPAGWITTGESIGASGDGMPNGGLSVSVETNNFTNANFGIQRPPIANSSSMPNQGNSGYSIPVPPTQFTGNDFDGGMVMSIRITAFPKDANGLDIASITINGVKYSSAAAFNTAFPAGATIATNPSGNPLESLAIQPIIGNVASVIIPYVTIDNAGAVSPAATVTIPFTVILPVTGLEIDITNNNNCEHQISWQTLTEVKALAYELQYSTDGSTWKQLATIAAIGNSNSRQDYQYINTKAAIGKSYYRIKAMDRNGSFIYSPIKTITTNCKAVNTISVYPNPVKDILTISGAEAGSKLVLADATGKVLLQAIATGSNVDKLNIGNIASGMYLLQVINTERNIKTIKVIKK